jgi:hypothetical protein
MLEKIKLEVLMKTIFLIGLISAFISVYFFVSTPKQPVYKNHNSLESTYLALQLSSTNSEFLDILGRPGDEILEKNIETFTDIVELDYFFIVLYVSLLLVMFQFSSKLTNLSGKVKVVFYLLIIFLSIIDLIQKFYLSELLNSNLSIQKDFQLKILFVISSLKWGGYFLIIGIIGITFWLGSMNGLLRISSLLLFIPHLFAIFSIIGNLNFLEIGLKISFVGFLGVWMYSSFQVYKNYVLKRNIIFTK